MRLTYAEKLFYSVDNEDMQGEVDYDLAEEICLREMKEEQELEETKPRFLNR